VGHFVGLDVGGKVGRFVGRLVGFGHASNWKEAGGFGKSFHE